MSILPNTYHLPPTTSEGKGEDLSRTDVNLIFYLFAIMIGFTVWNGHLARYRLEAWATFFVM